LIRLTRKGNNERPRMAGSDWLGGQHADRYRPLLLRNRQPIDSYSDDTVNLRPSSLTDALRLGDSRMYPIRRQALFAAIGLDPSAKIPADFSIEFTGVHVKDYSGIEHIFDVKIIPTRMNSWKGRPTGQWAGLTRPVLGRSRVESSLGREFKPLRRTCR
jgi:hypothetical protein